MQTFRAIQDRVLLEPVFAQLSSDFGLYLGEGEMTHGVVLAAGPDAVVQVGDKVLFNHDAGHQTKVRDKRVLVIRESEIYGVLED